MKKKAALLLACMMILTSVFCACGKKDAPVLEGEVREDQNCVLKVNGETLQVPYCYLDEQHACALLPLVEIGQALGADAAWTSGSEAKVQFQGKEIYLDLEKKCMYGAVSGNAPGWALPGNDYCWYGVVNGSFMLDSNNALPFLRALDAQCRIDWEDSVVEIWSEHLG